MYENIGRKIKMLAEIGAWAGIILAIFVGVWIISNGDSYLSLIGVIIIVIGGLISWIGSFFMYGFGQLVENSDKLAGNVSDSENNSRMATLNDLRERGLITEEEYQQRISE